MTLPLGMCDYEVLSTGKQVAHWILNPFRNYVVPSPMLRSIVRASRSPLIQETLRAPGGWKSMGIIHANALPMDRLDALALTSNPLSIETRNRRKLVTLLLTQIVNRLANQPFIQLLGIGAGPGLHLQDALRAAARPASSFALYLIDRDASAEAMALEAATERGHLASVKFILGDARFVQQVIPDAAPNVVKLVGLLEYLTDAEVLELLTALRAVMPAGSCVVTHGFVDCFHQAPFFGRVFGLRHHARSGEQLEELLTSAGFGRFERHATPLGIFPVRIAIAVS